MTRRRTAAMIRQPAPCYFFTMATIGAGHGGRFGGVGHRWLAGAAVVALASGCATVTYAGRATVTYPGPRRPSDQVAIIEARDLYVLSIDGMDVRDTRQRFEVLPGDHQLVVRLNYVDDYHVIAARHSSQPAGLCVIAQPGHHYALSANVAGNLWEAVVLDGGSHIQVQQCRAEWP
jgi:hypothetical protein